MKKKTKSVSIIGGADGPTSVFIVGKTDKVTIKKLIRSSIYRYKRKKASTLIKPGAHTLKEVLAYVKEKYQATEMPQHKINYIEQRRCHKENLIINNKPELLGDMKDISLPEVYDEDSLKEFHRRIQLRNEVIANIPDEEVPMDYHIYEITINGGSLELEIDFMWDRMACLYSGNSSKAMRRLKRISRDISMYYGVTEDDIINNTKRYSALLTELSL